MAHALAYVNFTANEGGVDHEFKSGQEFSEPEAVLQNYRPAKQVLGEYASTNYESSGRFVENFFERPSNSGLRCPTCTIHV